MIERVIEERRCDIGGFDVDRILPAAMRELATSFSSVKYTLELLLAAQALAQEAGKAAAKIGVLIGSILAAALGVFVILA